ncbi:hypothetical protein PAESOLCIP111_00792 [Paenibacillus solanacearum]|uniref:Ion transport domain-containing protein n=1 Tax=Paenibacillus solanacearum TaxID=2048548 RepID=A0A916NVC0_9BACL|nr:ion transporter [Paenibacillus solanacearum]CAG7605295.1 hypothetical protein PAESOLCIP111_00792 [Paenibacillus solanacearum]
MQLEKPLPARTIRARALASHPLFHHFVIVLIILNAILVGMETYPALYEPHERLFYWADRVLLWLFTVELGLRIWAARPLHSFFKDGWNVFDLLIVLSGHLFTDTSLITLLRILRILRVLRAISAIPSLRRIVNALLLTIPALGNITLLLSLLFYIFAVIGTNLFSALEPEYFGSLHQSLLTLFQIILVDGVMDIVRPLLDVMPWSWIYFVVFILLGTFVIFNLFVGVIVSNIEKVEREDREEDHAELAALRTDLKFMRDELREIKQLLEKNRE